MKHSAALKASVCTLRKAAGFTLIELAITVFIIALLLGSIMVPLATQIEQRQTGETQKKQEEVRDALMGFAVTNGYLPCPAISAANGQEDRAAGGACNKRNGFIPWETLGVSRADAWGRLYRYSVTPAFASSAALFSVSTAPDITIRTRDNAGTSVTLTTANSVPAVVLSHGKNGYGAADDQGNAQAAVPAANTDETANASGTTTFFSRTAQGAGAGGTGGEFDDLVIWLPRYTLLNRMIAAGKLP